MSDEDEEPASIIFRSELTDPAVPHVDLGFTMPDLWNVYEAIHLGGFDMSRKIVNFSIGIMSNLIDAGVSDFAVSFNEVWEQFGGVFDLPEQKWTNDTDLKLSFCYYLLRDELIDRTEAAELGRNLLEHHDNPVTPADVDAFRKRVDRWAERNGLPRPGQPRRRAVTA